MSKPLVLPGPHGRIEVAGDALDALAATALAPIDGAQLARGRHALELTAVDERLDVELQLTVRAGLVLPDVAAQVQQAVAEAVRGATGVEARVDVLVAGIDG